MLLCEVLIVGRPTHRVAYESCLANMPAGRPARIWRISISQSPACVRSIFFFKTQSEDRSPNEKKNRVSRRQCYTGDVGQGTIGKPSAPPTRVKKLD